MFHARRLFLAGIRDEDFSPKINSFTNHWKPMRFQEEEQFHEEKLLLRQPFSHYLEKPSNASKFSLTHGITISVPFGKLHDF